MSVFINTSRASIGLQGFPLVRSMEAAGFSTLLIISIILGVAYVFGMGLDLLPLGLTEYGRAINFPAPSFSQGCLFFGLLVCGLVLLSRSAEQDFQSLTLTMASNVVSVRGRLMMIFLFTLFGEGLFYGFYYFSSLASGNPISIIEVLHAPHRVGSVVVLFHYLFLPLASVVGALCVVGLYQLYGALMVLAKSLDLSLYRLPEYVVVSNTAVRFFLTLIIFLTFFPLAFLLGLTPYASVLINTFALLVLGLPVFGLLAYPVWTLRKRIRIVRVDALTGVVEKLEESGPSADLLSQLRFLESRSDWPVSGNIRQVLLFGLLPPITWALAAAVENWLY